MFGWLIDFFCGPSTAEESRFIEAKALVEALSKSDNPDWDQAVQLKQAIQSELAAIESRIAQLKNETGVFAGEIFQGHDEVNTSRGEYMKLIAAGAASANAELAAAEAAKGWLDAALGYL